MKVCFTIVSSLCACIESINKCYQRYLGQTRSLVRKKFQLNKYDLSAISECVFECSVVGILSSVKQYLYIHIPSSPVLCLPLM